MSFSDPVVVNANNYARYGDGKYLHTTFGSLDQPVMFEIKSTLDGKTPSIVIRRRNDVNNVVTGVDDFLDVYLVARGNASQLTATAIRAMVDDLNSFASATNLGRVLRGEK